MTNEQYASNVALILDDPLTLLLHMGTVMDMLATLAKENGIPSGDARAAIARVVATSTLLEALDA